MRSATKWVLRAILALLSFDSLLRLVDWGSRWDWLEGALAAHPYLALVVRGPLFPLICVLACVVIIYGERYLRISDIRAEIIRIELHPKLGLVPVKMMDEIHRIAGSETYNLTCDLMVEIFLVNHSDSTVTIRSFGGSIKTKSKTILLVPAEDFAKYTLKIERKNRSSGFQSTETCYEPLLDLNHKLHGIALHRGVGYQGWLGFTANELDRKEAEAVKFNLYVLDSLGNRHRIRSTKSKASEPDGNLPELVGPIDG